MKSARKLTAFALGAMIGMFASSLRADIYRLIGSGNTITPLKAADISMDAETVVVEPESDFGGFKVTAVFTMRNTMEEPATYVVAFPFESEAQATGIKSNFRVHVSANPGSTGDVVPVELKLRDQGTGSAPAADSRYNFPAALVWPVTWAARETKTIRLEYDMGEPTWYRGVVEGFRLSYIVRTGALWKGPIGRADITLRLTGSPMVQEEFSGKSPEGWSRFDQPYSYPDHARLVSPSEVSWHFENWTPDEDIWVAALRWIKLDDKQWGWRWMKFFYPLREPYEGATIIYTDQMLEQIVAREVEPWKEMFPNEISRDHLILKSAVAAWLHHEIFARHGDGFYLGKKGPGQPAPLGVAWDQDGNLFSEWTERFGPYRDNRKRNGWYKPGTGRGPFGSVRLEDLSELERRNLDFLKKYLPADGETKP